MAPQPQVHIDHPAAQLGDLALFGALALGQPHQRQQLGFAVVEHRPIGIGSQQTLQPLPKPGLTVLLQSQQWVIRRLGRHRRSGPAPFGIPRQAHKTVQKIVSGVGVGFDVVDQHPWCRD